MRLIDVLCGRDWLKGTHMTRKAEQVGAKTRAADQPVVTSSGQLSWSVRDILFSHQREAAVRTLRGAGQPPRQAKTAGTK